MAQQRVSQKLYAPPWRERQPDGTLGPEYGPRTVATYARQVAAALDWSFRGQSKASKRLEVLRDFMRLDDGTMRLGVPESEVRVYRIVVEQGHSTRWAAKNLGVNRATIQSYLRRLIVRAQRGG